MKGAAFVLAALPATLEAACTKDGCIFSAVSTSIFSGGPVRCGQVDAAPRMPDDIWNDPEAVKRYVEATIRYWSYTGTLTPALVTPLKQQGCASRTETGHGGKQIGPFPTGPKGSETINWVSPELMKLTCNAFCGCTYPDCPDVPDKPDANKYCSLCGPKFNAPFVISFYYESTADSVLVPPSVPLLTLEQSGNSAVVV